MKMKIPKIETKRLILRPFKLSDADRVRELAGNKLIADTTLNIPHPYEKGMAKDWISGHRNDFESGTSVHFAITLKPTRELIGAVGLLIEKKFNRAELGYWIGKDYWNKGYCTETAITIVEYGFKELRLNKIESSHFERNPASGKVMRNIGMKKEGFRREHVIKRDKYENLVEYAILKKEWKK
jgi:RimJ/RimL family protein N-acetyltransferase